MGERPRHRISEQHNELRLWKGTRDAACGLAGGGMGNEGNGQIVMLWYIGMRDVDSGVRPSGVDEDVLAYDPGIPFPTVAPIIWATGQPAWWECTPYRGMMQVIGGTIDKGDRRIPRIPTSGV